MRFWEARTGDTAHTTTRLGHSRSRPLTLSPSPGRAGQRKRFSCGRHRCLAQQPKMETDPAWTEVAARRRPPGRQSRCWNAPRGDWEGEYQSRRGGGGGGSAHLGPPPRSTACVGIRPRSQSRPQVYFPIAPPLSSGSPPSTRPALRSTVALAILFLATHSLSFVILAPPLVSLELLTLPSKSLSSRVRTLG